MAHKNPQIKVTDKGLEVWVDTRDLPYIQKYGGRLIFKKSEN